jgi:hypothetical protein
VEHTDHHRAEAVAIHVRDQPGQHALGAAGLEPGDQMRDRDHGWSFPFMMQ